MCVTLVCSGHLSFVCYYPFFSLGPVICYLELPLPLLMMRFCKSFSNFVLGRMDDPVTQDTNLVLPRTFFLNWEASPALSNSKARICEPAVAGWKAPWTAHLCLVAQRWEGGRESWGPEPCSSHPWCPALFLPLPFGLHGSTNFLHAWACWNWISVCFCFCFLTRDILNKAPAKAAKP